MTSSITLDGVPLTYPDFVNISEVTFVGYDDITTLDFNDFQGLGGSANSNGGLGVTVNFGAMDNVTTLIPTGSYFTPNFGSNNQRITFESFNSLTEIDSGSSSNLGYYLDTPNFDTKAFKNVEVVKGGDYFFAYAYYNSYYLPAEKRVVDFGGFSKLRYLQSNYAFAYSEFSTLNISPMISLYSVYDYFCRGCKASTINVKGLFSLAEIGKPGSTSGGCLSNCPNVTSLDLSDWTTLTIIRGSYNFCGNSSLESLDISGLSSFVATSDNSWFVSSNPLLSKIYIGDLDWTNQAFPVETASTDSKFKNNAETGTIYARTLAGAQAFIAKFPNLANWTAATY
jgi:hypothetical protein